MLSIEISCGLPHKLVNVSILLPSCSLIGLWMGNCSNIHPESAKVLLHLKVAEIQIQKEKTLKEHREELVPKLSVGFANMIFLGGNILTVTCWYSGMIRFWIYTDEIYHSFLSTNILFSILISWTLSFWQLITSHTSFVIFKALMNTESKHLKTAKQKRILSFFFFADNILDDFSIGEFSIMIWTSFHDRSWPCTNCVRSIIDLHLLPAGPVSIIDRTR